MSKIIDLKMDLPPSSDEMAKRMDFLISNKDGAGAANYRRIFGPRWASALGMQFEELEKKRKELDQEAFNALLVNLAQKITVTPDQFLRQLDEAGIEWCLIDDPDNSRTAAFIRNDPQRLKGSATFNPFEGDRGIRQMERVIRKYDFKAIYASPYLWGIKANDARFYPFYAKAAELDIPVFIYSTMNYRKDLPMDVGRPLYIDRVAMDFPNLRIVASSGGWPWVPELIGVARRHQNVFIDTSSHRPKYIGVPGSGFEMLLQFGNTLLQDQVVFGSGAGDLGLPIGQVVKEVRELPLKDAVKEKWLYGNALRLFKLEQ
jgi:predicted TIM-barrel fold metal-dependent hydrolase